MKEEIERCVFACGSELVNMEGSACSLSTYSFELEFGKI